MLAQYNFKEPTNDNFVQAYSDTPAGCVVYPVSAEAAVYLKIVGKVNFGTENEKAEAILAQARSKVEKSKKIMSAEAF